MFCDCIITHSILISTRSYFSVLTASGVSVKCTLIAMALVLRYLNLFFVHLLIFQGTASVTIPCSGSCNAESDNESHVLQCQGSSQCEGSSTTINCPSNAPCDVICNGNSACGVCKYIGRI